MFPRTFLVALSACAIAVGLIAPQGAVAVDAQAKRYIVVFSATEVADGTFVFDRAAGLSLVAAAGGEVSLDLTRQIGVAVAVSANALFADALRASGIVDEVGEEFAWKQFPSLREAINTGALTVVESDSAAAAASADPLESLQWSMQLIHTHAAHALQTGAPAVDVGILDTGIDGAHLDFITDGRSNVDCARGRDFIPAGPGAGNPVPCVDNGFHGTHVAGIVAARRNGHGVTGVAPNITLVPVKVCDAAGFCYSAATVAGITYAGDAKLDVINMSFFVDDDELLASTEFKCNSDPKQRAFRRANERALKYARSQGVTPVAALGNSDTDLKAQPCDVVPGESPGVVGVMALGARSQKASYSSFGFGPTDVGAPGGAGTTGNCLNTVLSTIPGNLWGCFQGTSMASPHATGVAALIESQFGTLGPDGDVVLAPNSVQSILQQTVIDIGLVGYDKCFGHGRIDALRAVQRDTAGAYDATAPFCTEYNE